MITLLSIEGKYVLKDATRTQRNYDPFDVRNADLSYEYKPKPKANRSGWLSLFDILKDKEPLRNKKGQFSVLVTDTDYVLELLLRAELANLTVRGDKSAQETSEKSISKGDFLVFGAESSRFDVDIVNEARVIKSEKYIPIYRIDQDWDTILEALTEMAEEKEKLFKKADSPEAPTYAMLKGTYKPKAAKKENTNVLIASTWIKVGDYFIPKREEDRVIFNFD